MICICVMFFAAVAVAVASYYLHRICNYWRLQGVPFRKPLPVFGNIINFLLSRQSLGTYLRELCNTLNKPYLVFFVFHRPFLVLKDPDIIKRVLVKDFHAFSNRMFASDEEIEPLMSYSLFATEVQQWKPLREKMSSIFSTGKIKQMAHLIKKCSVNLRTEIKNYVGKDIEIKNIASRYATDVTTSCTLGFDENSLLRKNSEFYIMGQKLFEDSTKSFLSTTFYFIAPEIVKMLRLRFIDTKTANYLREMFTKVITARQKETSNRNDLIATFCELKKRHVELHDDQLIAQMVFFFGAGYELISSTISFTLYEMCINTHIQDLLRNEIKNVTERHGDITYEAVQDMKYLNMVVSETLRKYAVNPFTTRVCTENYTFPGTGLTIQKGTPILIPILGLHWNREYFPDPEKYDPERFSDENKHKIPSCAYLPFGEGLRMCIGQRFALLCIKLAVIYVLKDFEVSKNPSTKDHLTFTTARLIQPECGIRLTLTDLLNK